MKVYECTIKGITPLLQGRHIVEEKLDKESPYDYEKRCWRERMHADEDGNVYLPAAAFKNMMIDAAGYLGMNIKGKGKSTYTKHFRSGIFVSENMSLNVKKDDVPGLWLFVPVDGKRGGSKRVDRCFPIIHQWGGKVRFYILDETITLDIFKIHLTEAGRFIGLGSMRPHHGGDTGRFEVVDIQEVSA